MYVCVYIYIYIYILFVYLAANLLLVVPPLPLRLHELDDGLDGSAALGAHMMFTVTLHTVSFQNVMFVFAA